MFFRLKLLRYENPIILVAIVLVAIFLIGGIVFGIYKLASSDKELPTVGGKEESVELSDDIRFPEKLEGVEFTYEELEAANAAMNDEGAYEGGYEDTSALPESETYMEGAIEPYVDEEKAAQISTQYKMTETETVAYIRKEMSKIPDDGWISMPLDVEQKKILEKIKNDPKNCYPEFASSQEFEFVQQGYSFTFYTEFVANVLMCYGNINNYNAGIY